MFELNSTDESPKSENVPSSKVSKAAKKSRPKIKAKGFPELTTRLSNWNPSDAQASRRLLANEIRLMLEENEHNCVKACIPALIVDGSYPIDLMHYRTEQDIYEFLTRMLWMHQEYDSAIGILLGIPDKETSMKIEDACGSLLNTEKDCIVLLF